MGYPKGAMGGPVSHSRVCPRAQYRDGTRSVVDFRHTAIPIRPLWRFAKAACSGFVGIALAAISCASQAADQNKTKGTGEQSRLAVAEKLSGHGGPVHAVQISNDGRLAVTGSFDYAVACWDLTQRPAKQICRFDQHDGPVKAVLLVPGTPFILSAGDGGYVRLWDRKTGKNLFTSKRHLSGIHGLAVSQDGRWAASASRDRTVRIWDLKARKMSHELVGHTGPVNAVQFSRDGAYLFSAASDGTVRRWRRDRGIVEGILYKHGFGVTALRLVPGQNALIFGAIDGRSGVIDAKTGALITSFPRHDGPVLAVATLAKPGLIALGGTAGKGRKGVIRVYRSGDWALLEAFDGPRGPIWALAFSRDGAKLYHGGLDDFVSVWQVRPRKPFEPVAGPFIRRFQVSRTISLGERQFARKCSLCHTLKKDGKNRAGPSLYNLFGRRAGTVAGYPYSDALKKSKIVWTAETIGKLFDLGPDHYTPGSKMPLQKISDRKTRDALIDYLKSETSPGAEPTGPGGDRQKTE